MDLSILDWTEAYLKYKDTVQRKILKMESFPDKNELICTLKDGSVHKYICLNDVSSFSVKQLDNARVSCLNSKKNVDWLISNWQELKNTSSVFLFANPKKASHWSITPKVHDSIIDKTAIKPGIKSLFESIPEA